MTAAGTGRTRKLLDRRHDALVVLGAFDPLVETWRRHAREHGVAPDPLGETMMRQALAAACLELALEKGSVWTGWTLHVEAPPINLFVTGDSEAGDVAGRVFAEGVAAQGGSRMFVQSQPARGRLMQSSVPIDGLDVLEHFETFDRLSRQLPTRLFELEDGRFAAVRALPECDRDWLDRLDRSAVARLEDDDAVLLEERTYRFRCGCDRDKMVEILRSMFGDRPDALFRGEPEVEAHCPRCGARWRVSRAAFDAPAS